MERPSCVVRVTDLPEEKRPRRVQRDDTGASVRAVGDSVGLTRMGVWYRAIEPGKAGTFRHFHTVEEEWAYVLAGRGLVRIGPHTLPVRAGHFVGFPPGPRPHHFLSSTDDPLVLLEGGERRRDEDHGFYVDLGDRWEPGFKLEKITEPLPPEEGDRSQLLHVDDAEARAYQHPVDPRARRERIRNLSAPTGLLRQAVRWSRVRAGDRSTAYHTHTTTDEWVYILEGRASARVGDASFAVEAGDFLGHPAGSAPHGMEAIADLTYLMGGMIDSNDVVLYPDAGQQRRAGRLEPLERPN